MRRIETLRRLHRSLRRRVSRTRHAETNPRVRSRRAHDRIRLARRFETAEGRPRSRLRTDTLAQRIHRPPPRPAAPLSDDPRFLDAPRDKPRLRDLARARHLANEAEPGDERLQQLGVEPDDPQGIVPELQLKHVEI